MSSLISILTDFKNHVTKHFYLDANGKLVKTSPEHITNGTIESHLVDVQGLIEIITNLNSHQCLCLGALEKFDTKQPIKCLAAATDGFAARTKKFLDYRGGNSWVLLDFDESGKSPADAIQLLSTIDPQLTKASLVVVPSSSSYLYKNTGEEILGVGNYHIFIECEGDGVKYVHKLFDKMLLNGYGIPHVTKAGTVVIKTLFDRSTASYEREIFNASPMLDANLVSKRLEHIEFQEGTPIVEADLPDVTPEEHLKLRQLYIELRESVSAESSARREEYNEERAANRARVKNTSKLYELAAIQNQSTIYTKTGTPIVELLSNEILKDNDGNDFFARDILIDPTEEPIKIPSVDNPYRRGDKQRNLVGRGCATILPGFRIYDHSNYGILYTVRWEAEDLIEFMNSTQFSVDDKKLVWRMISVNQQQLASATTDSEISEIADAVKNALATVSGSGVSKEKATIKKKLNPASDPDIKEDEIELSFNAQYGVGVMGGKTVVISESWNKSIEAYETVIAKPFELETFYRNQQVRTPGQTGTRSAFAAWMDTADRNTFGDIYFEPVPYLVRKPNSQRIIQQGGSYNLYTGIVADTSKAVHPERILWHLENVWCSGKQDEFEYLCGWLAHLFQHPNRVNGTALVLQSIPGAGKNIIIDNCIVKPFGQHAMSTTRKDDFLGKFNKQLGLNVFLYANESIWAGDHSDKNAIKTLITDAYRSIELKGIDAVKARNYSNVIFGSNGAWVMNIESQDRRFCYLTVSGVKAKDSGYFEKLSDEIKNGGIEGFVKYFLEYDISGFDITDIPVGNMKQRNADMIRSSHPTIRFFLALLDEESSTDVVYDMSPKLKTIRQWHSSQTEPMIMSREHFFDMYTTYAKYHQMGTGYDDAVTFQRELETAGYLAPSLFPETHEGYAIVPVVSEDGKRREWKIKSVKECRKLIFKTEEY